MIEILRKIDLARVAHYPREIVETIQNSIVRLDREYGTNRTRNGDGGLELIVESEEELCTLLKTLPFGDIPESVEVLHRDFLHVVYLISNERSISVCLPKKWATKSMLEVL